MPFRGTLLAALCVATSGSLQLRGGALQRALTSAEAPAAAAGHHPRVPGGSKLISCYGRYALCAAAACEPVSTNISVLQRGGPAKDFPAVVCTCPVVEGLFFGSPGTGNMPAGTGCTEPPPDEYLDGAKTVWSMHSMSTTIPTAAAGWAPDTPALSTVCTDVPFANCHSFSCNKIAPAPSGVALASCYCPMNANTNGVAVDPADNSIFTKGQCAEYPVGYAEAISGENDMNLPDVNDAAFLHAVLGSGGRARDATSPAAT